MTLRFPTRALALSLLALAMPLAADTADPTAAIAQRQANYKTINAAFKAIRETLKTDAPDRPAMVAAAATVAATAPAQASLFPPGSGPEAGVKTDALPAIWSDRAAFDAMMRDFAGASTTLAAATRSGDLAAVGAAVAATGATCAACHKRFRADS